LEFQLLALVTDDPAVGQLVSKLLHDLGEPFALLQPGLLAPGRQRLVLVTVPAAGGPTSASLRSATVAACGRLGLSGQIDIAIIEWSREQMSTAAFSARNLVNAVGRLPGVALADAHRESEPRWRIARCSGLLTGSGYSEEASRLGVEGNIVLLLERPGSLPYPSGLVPQAFLALSLGTPGMARSWGSETGWCFLDESGRVVRPVLAAWLRPGHWHGLDEQPSIQGMLGLVNDPGPCLEGPFSAPAQERVKPPLPGEMIGTVARIGSLGRREPGVAVLALDAGRSQPETAIARVLASGSRLAIVTSQVAGSASSGAPWFLRVAVVTRQVAGLAWQLEIGEGVLDSELVFLVHALPAPRAQFDRNAPVEGVEAKRPASR
jgi:hypothetical protein